MATREEVIWLYRCLLHREPESEEAVSSHMNNTFHSLRSALLVSEECEVNRLTSLISQPVKYRSAAAENRTSPRLAVAAIVKNEQDNIVKMLTSILPLASYVVVIDTGSSDDTIVLCKAVLLSSGIAHEVSSVEFKDFSHARNHALDRVPSGCKWTLMLDADEYIIVDDYQGIAKCMQNTDVEAWCLPRYNFVDSNKELPPKDYPDYQRRLLRNLPHIRFAGRVHEHVRGARKWGFAPPNLLEQGGFRGGPHIHHTALIDLSYEKAHRKRLLYDALLINND